MAKVKIQGHASGTGVLTVTAPNTSTDRTITLPDSTGTLATTADNGSQLDHSGSKKIEATATGVDVTGIAVTDGITSSGNITFDNGNSSVSIKSDGANGSYIQFGSNEYLRFLYDNGASESIRLIDGGGITFNGDTAAANALSDYEEGTWTPAFTGTGGGSGQVYSDQSGKYTKIGNKCFCSCNLQLSTKGTISGFVKINGFPFNFGSGATATDAGTHAYAHKWDLDSGHVLESWVYNTNTLYLMQTNYSGDAPTQLTTGHMQNTTGVKVTFSYTTE